MKSDLNVQSYNFLQKVLRFYTAKKQSQMQIIPDSPGPLLSSPLWPLTQLLVVAGASLSLWQGAGGPRLRCQECGREMKNEHSLSVHISRYHNDKCAPTQALCPVCRKVYSNQYSLRTHMHLQHKDKLFLLGQKKRGRRPGSSASVTSLNKDIFPTLARQQSHYHNAHENEDLLENSLSVSSQDSKNVSILDMSRLQ